MDQPGIIKTFAVQGESGDIGVCMIVTTNQELSPLGIGFHNGATKVFLREDEYRDQKPDWERPVIILQYLGNPEKSFGPLKPIVYQTPEHQRALLISFQRNFEHVVSPLNRVISPFAAFFQLVSMISGILRNSVETGMDIESAISLLRSEMSPEFIPNLDKIIQFGLPIFMDLEMAKPELSFGKVCAQCPVNKVHLATVLNQLLSEFIIIHPESLPPSSSN